MMVIRTDERIVTPPRKRPYRPKVKGCYECSRRRVSCDRRVPECGKCCSRGLKCSGVDNSIRIRFADGVSSRGKWAGETIQSLCEKRTLSRETAKRQEATVHHAHSKPFSLSRADEAVDSGESPVQEVGVWDEMDSDLTAADVTSLGTISWKPLGLSESIQNCVSPSPNFPGRALLQFDGDIEHEDSREPSDSQACSGLPLTCSPASMSGRMFTELPFDDIPPWKRGLLLHYSKHIAGEMIALDGIQNGWRYIVLPMAHTDELVMTAVLTVAAFHREAMSRRDGIEYGIMCNADDGESRDHQVPSWTDPIPTSPQALYNRALEGLRQRSNLLGIAHEDPEATIAAVLVLLVTTMVTGRDDYATILGMLYSATEALGGEEKLSQTELGKFLIRQVRKMRVYAAPHISEWAGMETLTSLSRWDQCFDCVRHCSQGRPETATVIIDVMQQAHDIYVQAAMEIRSLPSSVCRRVSMEREQSEEQQVELLMQTLQRISIDEPGANVLVWATFLGAAASSQQRHREFFKGLLLQHYRRSRFINLLRGIQYLPYMWEERDLGSRWTQLMAEAKLFLM